MKSTTPTLTPTQNRVLLLEDDAGMQSFLQTLLQSQGYQLQICAEGLSGLSCWRGSILMYCCWIWVCLISMALNCCAS